MFWFLFYEVRIYESEIIICDTFISIIFFRFFPNNFEEELPTMASINNEIIVQDKCAESVAITTATVEAASTIVAVSPEKKIKTSKLNNDGCQTFDGASHIIANAYAPSDPMKYEDECSLPDQQSRYNLQVCFNSIECFECTTVTGFKFLKANVSIPLRVIMKLDPRSIVTREGKTLIYHEYHALDICGHCVILDFIQEIGGSAKK
jgi:hypothetical protein